MLPEIWFNIHDSAQQIEFIEKEKSEGVAQQAAFMLKLWVDAEADEANKESLLYILEGLKMQEAAQGVFTWEGAKHF